MAALFKGLIPIEVLGQMPLPFVHILRDQRIKQLEAKRRQNEIMTNRMSNQHNIINQPSSPQQGVDGFDESAIEQLIEDGLT